jgi:hypothetical protein
MAGKHSDALPQAASHHGATDSSIWMVDRSHWLLDAGFERHQGLHEKADARGPHDRQEGSGRSQDTKPKERRSRSKQALAAASLPMPNGKRLRDLRRDVDALATAASYYGLPLCLADSANGNHPFYAFYRSAAPSLPSG